VLFAAGGVFALADRKEDRAFSKKAAYFLLLKNKSYKSYKSYFFFYRGLNGQAYGLL
jgi:hypothetical protein